MRRAARSLIVLPDVAFAAQHGVLRHTLRHATALRLMFRYGMPLPMPMPRRHADAVATSACCLTLPMLLLLLICQRYLA